MRDTEFYRRILGLESPWRVSRVELSVEAGRVDVWLDHPRGSSWCCPKCAVELSCRDHSEERCWRHLDTCQFETVLHARVPRVECPEHGVRQVGVAWAESRSRFTLLFEHLAIEVLLQCATVTGASRLLGLSWDETWGIMQRAVARGLGRKTAEVRRHLGVDEKAFRRGHRYMTIVCDLERSTVEYVADGRKRSSLDGFWTQLTTEQLEGIQGIAMDMWLPYFNSTVTHLPDAAKKIVFDRFHVMKHMNDAVDKVRRQEHKELRNEGESPLTHTRYLWLRAEENLPDKHRPVFDSLVKMNLKVGRAWAIKETLRDLWSYTHAGWARRFFKNWYGWARRSQLGPVKKVALMIRNHLENIVTFCRHRITNAAAEGINSRIQAIKSRARGYRNVENFKIAIYFFCGGLDLDPR